MWCVQTSTVLGPRETGHDSLCHWRWGARGHPRTRCDSLSSWHTMKGDSLHKISKFLGHTSETTTETHYAGLVPESLHEDIEKLGS